MNPVLFKAIVKFKHFAESVHNHDYAFGASKCRILVESMRKKQYNRLPVQQRFDIENQTDAARR